MLRLLEALGTDGLRPAEQTVIREAADALFFCTDDVPDEEARAALARLREALDVVVAEGRYRFETADGILDAVEACGPEPLRV